MVVLTVPISNFQGLKDQLCTFAAQIQGLSVVHCTMSNPGGASRAWGPVEADHCSLFETRVAAGTKKLRLMQAIDSLMKEASIPLTSDLSDLMSCLDVKMRVVFHIRNIDDVSAKKSAGCAAGKQCSRAGSASFLKDVDECR